MKFGLPAGIGVVLLAIDMAVIGQGDFTPYGELTALAAVVGMLVWLVTRGIPNMLERWTAQMIAERQAHDKKLDDVRTVYREDLKLERMAFRESLKEQTSNFDRWQSDSIKINQKLSDTTHSLHQLVSELPSQMERIVKGEKLKPPPKRYGEKQEGP